MPEGVYYAILEAFFFLSCSFLAPYAAPAIISALIPPSIGIQGGGQQGGLVDGGGGGAENSD